MAGVPSIISLANRLPGRSVGCSPLLQSPIQMFNKTSRPEAVFLQNAAAASFILVLMTLTMNGLAIWLRCHLRKNIEW